MDLGIVQLVPRDVAIAAGRATGRCDSDACRPSSARRRGSCCGRCLPVALVGMLPSCWLLPAEWAPLRWPLAIVIVAFVVAFPLRMFNAVLQGLQDLAFLGGVQLAAWAAGSGHHDRRRRSAVLGCIRWRSDG